jgi:hypothetical protein
MDCNGSRVGIDAGTRAERLVATGVSVGVLAVAFGALALGLEWFWVAFPVGYGGVLPLSVALVRANTGNGTASDGGDAPVAAAADAYVRGEVDEAGLERRLEAALEDRTGETGRDADGG